MYYFNLKKKHYGMALFSYTTRGLFAWLLTFE